VLEFNSFNTEATSRAEGILLQHTESYPFYCEDKVVLFCWALVILRHRICVLSGRIGSNKTWAGSGTMAFLPAWHYWLTEREQSRCGTSPSVGSRALSALPLEGLEAVRPAGLMEKQKNSASDWHAIVLASGNRRRSGGMMHTLWKKYCLVNPRFAEGVARPWRDRESEPITGVWKQGPKRAWGRCL